MANFLKLHLLDRMGRGLATTDIRTDGDSFEELRIRLHAAADSMVDYLKETQEAGVFSTRSED